MIAAMSMTNISTLNSKSMAPPKRKSTLSWRPMNKPQDWIKAGSMAWPDTYRAAEMVALRQGPGPADGKVRAD